MYRPFFVLVVLCTCLGSVHGRTSAGSKPAESAEPAAEKPKPKRVLFRSDSPRLFAPRTDPARPPAKTAKATPPPTPGRVSRVRSPMTRLAPVPTPPPKLRLVQPVAPTLPKPEARPRPPATPPLPSELRIGRRFDIDFQPTTFTPYDRYLGTVKAVIAQLDPRDASMVKACELVQECRKFRYTTTDLYRADPPEVTEARRAGDCKSKALWVYDHLGDPAAYYVIGKLARRSRTSHAWVYWRNNGRWWILDPTVRSAPIAADTVSSARYVPYYSFSRAGAFRHSATRLMMAANGIPAATPTTAVRERSPK